NVDRRAGFLQPLARHLELRLLEAVGRENGDVLARQLHAVLLFWTTPGGEQGRARLVPDAPGRGVNTFDLRAREPSAVPPERETACAWIVPLETMPVFAGQVRRPT